MTKLWFMFNPETGSRYSVPEMALKNPKKLPQMVCFFLMAVTTTCVHISIFSFHFIRVLFYVYEFLSLI